MDCCGLWNRPHILKKLFSKWADFCSNREEITGYCFNLQTNQIVLKEGNKTGSEYAMVRGDLQFIPDLTLEDYRSHLYGEEEGEMGNRRMEIRNEEWRE